MRVRVDRGRLSIAAVAVLLLAGVSGSTPARAAVAVQAPAGAAADPDVAAVVADVLGRAEHPGLTWPAIPDVAGYLAPLYDAEPDRLLWFDGRLPVAAVESTVAALATADAHGLAPSDYDSAPLAEQWRSIRAGRVAPSDRALFDLGLSVAAARLLTAVRIGRVDPATLQWGYDISPKRFDMAAELRTVRDGSGMVAAMDRLAPPFSHYQRARRTLAAYRALLARGEPPLVPDLPKGRTKVSPGDRWNGVPVLAARLAVFGDLAQGAPGGDATLYGTVLATAVRAFQARHGLDADGIVGAGTLRTVNVSVAHRVRQIELAMERMRWLPELSDRPNVFVNVALFRLWATDPLTGDEPLRMNVVVGKSLDHRTPIFVERMEYVVFRPYWNPPRSITVKEIVPHIRRDPAYFDRENLEIVASGADDAAALPPSDENLARVLGGRLFLRQKPGPANSLGLAKFIFPNDEDVYMHGTPAPALFARVRRDFSHGCIRLEDPARFASWVLRDQPEWTAERIAEAMQADRPTRVNLRQPLTVVLFYDTVHVNSEAVVFFVDDIYGHDRTLDAALQAGYPYPVSS